MKGEYLLLDGVMQEGIIILIVGLITVFSALVSLFVVFHYLVPWILAFATQRMHKGDAENKQQVDFVSGEQIAAAAAAVHLYLNEVHDDENAILTIHESVKEYSPWSSKIYATHHMGKN